MSFCNSHDWDNLFQVFDNEEFFESEVADTYLFRSFSSFANEEANGSCIDVAYFNSSETKAPVKVAEDSMDEPLVDVSLEEIVGSRATNSMSLPNMPSRFYARAVVDALNTFDYASLLSKLKSMCATNVRLRKHIYFCSEDANPIRSYTFPSLEAFCSFLSAWFVFVPDGVFETSQHRVALNSLPTFVFVSCFRFTGKKLLKDLDLLRTAFHEYPLQYHERVALNSGNPHYPVDCTIDGSLAIHVNKHGIVTEIEIYLTQ